MSVHATSWVWRLDLPPNEKYVLLCYADATGPTGITLIGQETAARETGLSSRAVGENLRRIEKRGLVVRVRRNRPNGSRTTDYTILAPKELRKGTNLAVPGAEEVPKAVRDFCLPEESSGPPTGSLRSPTGSEGGDHIRLAGTVSDSVVAPAPARGATYRGKRVPLPIVEEAGRLLTVFGEATGRKLGSRCSDGSPSPNLRQIIGGLLSRPEVEPDRWEAAIRNTVAAPPRWLDGPVQLGHVFGEKAAEWALSNGGEQSRNGISPAKQARVDRFMDALASYTKEG